jgi:hypothetical protein
MEWRGGPLLCLTARRSNCPSFQSPPRDVPMTILHVHSADTKDVMLSKSEASHLLKVFEDEIPRLRLGMTLYSSIRQARADDFTSAAKFLLPRSNPEVR